MAGEIILSYGISIKANNRLVRKKMRPENPPCDHRATLSRRGSRNAPPLNSLAARRFRSLHALLDNGVPHRVRLAWPDRAEFDHIVRIEIRQLQPVFGNVRRWEQ